MAKAKTTVILRSPAGDVVTFFEGDTLPRWANVTNPAVADQPKQKNDKTEA